MQQREYDVKIMKLYKVGIADVIALIFGCRMSRIGFVVMRAQMHHMARVMDWNFK